jgi:hypothetical protein
MVIFLNQGQSFGCLFVLIPILSECTESGSIKSLLKKQRTDKTTGKQTPTKLSSKQTDIQITDPSSVKSPSKRQKIEKLSKQTPTKLVSKQTDSQNSVPGSGKSPSTRQKNRNLSQTESDVVSINVNPIQYFQMIVD